MAQTRVHVRSVAINAAQVSKKDGVFTIRDVCGAVDDIVMNGMLYPGPELAAGAPSLEGKPAPFGHPRNSAGQHISATSGQALLTSYGGAICTNARHTGGRTLVDLLVNEAQAQANPKGAILVKRLQAMADGAHAVNEDAGPVHVSTGLTCNAVIANGESGGKQYSRIATAINYDHLAILLDEQGAGTPEQGVGMWLNAAGEAQEVEAATLDAAPADKRHAGLMGWLRKLIGNESDLSFDQIADSLRAALPAGAWLREVYQRHVIYVTEDDKLWRRDYAISSDGASVSFTSEPAEVVRRVEYQPVVTNQQEKDVIKEMLVAALNAAGIQTEGKSDAQVLEAYNAHVSANAVRPVQEQLSAANAKVATFEANAAAAENAKRDALVTKLATNSAGLTADELKALPLTALEKLAGNTQTAAAVIVGNAGQGGSASGFATYDLNAVLEGK